MAELAELAGLLLGIFVISLILVRGYDEYIHWREYQEIKRWSKHK